MSVYFPQWEKGLDSIEGKASFHGFGAAGGSPEGAFWKDQIIDAVALIILEYQIMNIIDETLALENLLGHPRWVQILSSDPSAGRSRSPGPVQESQRGKE